MEVGFKIPILDWGKRRGQVKIAQSNRDVTESKLRQETMNFNQNLFILVEQFNNQQAQLQIADDSDKIAQKRYSTNVLFYYWYYYYQLRSLTLWDFNTNTNIDADFEKIIKQ